MSLVEQKKSLQTLFLTAFRRKNALPVMVWILQHQQHSFLETLQQF